MGRSSESIKLGSEEGIEIQIYRWEWKRWVMCKRMDHTMAGEECCIVGFLLFLKLKTLSSLIFINFNPMQVTV